MDLQDLQDDRRSDLQFGEVTEKIILYILSIHVHSFCSKNYASVLSWNKNTNRCLLNEMASQPVAGRLGVKLCLPTRQ